MYSYVRLRFLREVVFFFVRFAILYENDTHFVSAMYLWTNSAAYRGVRKLGVK